MSPKKVTEEKRKVESDSETEAVQQRKKKQAGESIVSAKPVESETEDDDLAVVTKKKYVAKILPKETTDYKIWNVISFEEDNVNYVCFHNKTAYQAGVLFVCNHIGNLSAKLPPCGFSASVTTLKQIVERDFIKEKDQIKPVRIKICLSCKSAVLRIQEWDSSINKRGTVYLSCKCDKTKGIHTERLSGELERDYEGPFDNYAIDVYSKKPTKKSILDVEKTTPITYEVDF